MGLLSGFQHAAVFLGIDTLSADTLSPLGRILTGLDIIGVQLICHTTTVFAVLNGTLLIPGQFLTSDLLSKSLSNGIHIAGFAQFTQPLGHCALDGGHITRYNMTIQPHQLTAG